jgi:hypothetical protein
MYPFLKLMADHMHKIENFEFFIQQHQIDLL